MEHHTQIDWKLCILCQKNTKEHVQSPMRNKRATAEEGYATLAQTLDKCRQYDFYPFTTDLGQLDEGDGFEHTLLKHQGCWHKSCLLKINKTKLERVEKRKSAELLENLSERSVKFTRQSAPSPVPCVCFICNTTNDKEELRNVSTFQVDEKVCRCANVLQDQKLLMRISGSDLIAQEAKYHLTCLVLLYTKADCITCGGSDID